MGWSCLSAWFNPIVGINCWATTGCNNSHCCATMGPRTTSEQKLFKVIVGRHWFGLTLVQKWPKTQQPPCITLVQERPWTQHWTRITSARIPAWCDMKDASGMLVYSKEYAFPFLLLSFLSVVRSNSGLSLMLIHVLPFCSTNFWPTEWLSAC
jgi:hypothetical protein